MQEMNDAVALQPNDVAVLIPRAATFLSAAQHVPNPDIAKRDFQVAATDYEKVLSLQSANFSALPVHSKGELLGALAEASHGLGDEQKADTYLRRMMQELPGSVYEHRAKEVLATVPRKPGPLGITCLGCHSGA